MKRDIWNVVKYFLMYWVFYLLPVIVAAVAMRIYERKTGLDIDIREGGTVYWFLVLGAVLGVFFFLKWKYAEWKLGRIRRERMWQVIAVSVAVVLGWFFFDFFLQDTFNLEGGHAEGKVDEGLGLADSALEALDAVSDSSFFAGELVLAVVGLAIVAFGITYLCRTLSNFSQFSE